METIVNNPGGGSGDGSGVGVGMIVGILLVILVVVLFFVYGLPAMRGTPTSDDGSIDVNVTLPAGDNSEAAPAQ